MELARQALVAAEQAAAGDPFDLSVAQALNVLGRIFLAKSDYAAARPLLERSLSIREKSLGPENSDVAASLNNLGILYAETGDIARAEVMYRRSLEIDEKALGPDHRNVAFSLNNLGNLYSDTGNYAKAEPLFQRALATWEKLVGPDDLEVATPLDGLASLLRSKGDYFRAEPLYRRSLAIREKTLGPRHPEVAKSLNNLGLLYYDESDYSQAEALHLRALSIQQEAFGPDAPDVAASLNNLALSYSAQGNVARAEPMYRRSLAIWEKTLGPEHLAVAESLNNLADLYLQIGHYERAARHLQRCLSIRMKALGARNPVVATVLVSQAKLAWSLNDGSGAVVALERATEIEEKNLALVLATGSEFQKRSYIDTLARSTDIAISLHLQGASDSSAAARLASTIVLRRKGRVLDALLDGMAVLRSHLSAGNQTLLDQLNDVRSQLAAWFYQSPGDDPTVYHARGDMLEGRHETLESLISKSSAEFRQITDPVLLSQVQLAIPKDTALVEWVRYQPTAPGLSNAATDAMPSRYAAFVLRRGGDPSWFDLGDAAAIDAAVMALRKALTDPDSEDVSLLERQLHRQVFEPLQARLRGARLLLLSPDASLNLVPLAVLRDADNRFLVERYTLDYLTSSHDLLRPATKSAHRQSVILAAPDFDRADAVADGRLASLASGQRSIDLGHQHYDALPGTLNEARAVSRFLNQPAVLLGAQANTDAIKHLHGPRILHVATHGFFVANPDPRPVWADQENPLLRSGLVFAGANVSDVGIKHGIFTALEAAGLDLDGTELVVLSACDTALGDMRGEGVYGLRRAFAIAGAQSQVMSLWKVDDEATRVLMSDYYSRLVRGVGRGEALRQAQRAMMRDARYRHPYFWAPFIPIGQWRPLPPGSSVSPPISFSSMQR
ncbi:MAG: CHAT domain-containing protein [Burkholderiales bacterium]|nr:CHAT domain-containing protein [Burkholderiales bacterium]